MNDLPEWIFEIQALLELRLWGMPVPAILGAELLLIVLMLNWHPNRHPMNGRR